jgi:nitric oxide dioxygenase
MPFMKAINRSLKDFGVSEEQIHFEFFGPMDSLEEQEQKEIVTVYIPFPNFQLL